MHIKKLAINETPPIDLLLTADPSKDLVEKYVAGGQCYLAKSDEKVVGVYVLLKTAVDTFEIANIAVAEGEQNSGIGKTLISHAKKTARKQGISKLEVGTGNSSIGQLAFYQKCGFRIVAIDFDYFIKFYEEKIIENGIVCRDMIRLRMDLGEGL